jgi:hypothetical protein
LSDIKKIPLISSEITGIWNSYMGESLISCLLKSFISNVADTETLTLMQDTLKLSSSRIEVLTNLFNQEKIPIPEAFTDDDINLNAPRLFTDGFYLQYLGYTSRIAMQNYTLILNQIARIDIRDYFTKCITEYISLYNRSADLRLSKGIFIRAPRVEVPKKVQYVENKNFIIEHFGEKRPLLTIEITHAFSNIFANIIRKAFLTGFKQVCKSDKKISDYISEGITMATKHTGILNSLLTSENIPITSSSDSYVTDSIVSPFSQKLILNKITIMCSAELTGMGMALADVRRSDLQSTYVKFTADILKSSNNCADIMIDNRWYEQPPQAVKHENLVGAGL